jgi:hypothetical protein
MSFYTYIKTNRLLTIDNVGLTLGTEKLFDGLSLQVDDIILRTDEKSKVKKMIEEVKKLGINSNTISTMAVQDKAYKYRYGIMVPV